MGADGPAGSESRGGAASATVAAACGALTTAVACAVLALSTGSVVPEAPTLARVALVAHETDRLVSLLVREDLRFGEIVSTDRDDVLAVEWSGVDVQVEVVNGLSDEPVLFIDSDCDGELELEELVPPQAYLHRDAGRVSARIELPGASGEPASFRWSVWHDRHAGWRGWLIPFDARWGRVPLPGVEIVAVLPDADTDGSYGDESLGLDIDGDSWIAPPELVAVGERVRVGDAVIELRALDPAGRHADLAVHDGDAPADRDVLDELRRGSLPGGVLPDLTLETIDGEDIDAGDLLGDVALVHFGLDRDMATVRRVARRFDGLRIAIVRDPDDSALRTRAWGRGLPTTFLVGRDGRIVSRDVRLGGNGLDADESARLIDALLAGEAPTPAPPGMRAARPDEAGADDALPPIVFHDGEATRSLLPEYLRDMATPAPLLGREEVEETVRRELGAYPRAVLDDVLTRVLVVGDLSPRSEDVHGGFCGQAFGDVIALSSRSRCLSNLASMVHHEIAHAAAAFRGLPRWTHAPIDPASRNREGRRRAGFVTQYATTNRGEDFAEVSERLFRPDLHARGETSLWCEAATSGQLAVRVAATADFWESLDPSLDRSFFAARASDPLLAARVLGIASRAFVSDAPALEPLASPGPHASPGPLGPLRPPEPDAGARAGAPERWRRPRDGAVMIHLARAHRTLGASADAHERLAVELSTLPVAEHPWRHSRRRALQRVEVERTPERTVDVRAFLIDEHEVTWAQLEQFAAATGRRGEWRRGFDRPEDPARGVTWIEADAYCRWAGGRLPSGDEWEAAARSPDGPFPWGGEEPTLERVHATVAIDADGDLVGPLAAGTRPAGASPHGVLDLAGNVAEWTRCPPAWGTRPCSVRGASFRGDSALLLHPAFHRRLDPCQRDDALGFRCAADPP